MHEENNDGKFKTKAKESNMNFYLLKRNETKTIDEAKLENKQNFNICEVK